MRALLVTTLLVLVSYLSCEAMKLPSLREDKTDDDYEVSDEVSDEIDEVSEYSGNTFCVDWVILCNDANAANATVEDMEKDLKNAKDEDAKDILNESINWMKPISAKCNDETVQEKCKAEKEELDGGEEKVEEEEALDEGEEMVEDEKE